MPKKKPKAGAAPAPPEPAQPIPTHLTLRTENGRIFTLTYGNKVPAGNSPATAIPYELALFQKEAYRWNYLLSQRRRWVNDATVREEHIAASRDLLFRMGLTEADIRELAQSEILELGIPFHQEMVGWESRLFPWEYILTSATAVERRGRSQFIIRHLDCPDHPARFSHQMRRFMTIKNAPGPLHQCLTPDGFDIERSMIENSIMDLIQDEFRSEVAGETSEDETAEQLAARIKAFHPDIIHVTGFSPQHGQRLQVWNGESKRDGLLVKSTTSEIELLEADKLAAVFSGGTPKPALVACNLSHSAARICPALVRAGCGTALGFQDEFEGELAEIFFSAFYQALAVSAGNILEAFRFGCTLLRQHPKGLRGTGVVLWSSLSLLTQPLAQARQKAPHSFDSIKRVIQQTKLPAVSTDTVDDWVQVEIEPFEELNYALLHNRRGLFRKFLIRKLKPGPLRHVNVEVKLYAGSGETFPYRKTLHLLDQSSVDLKNDISVPLLFATGLNLSDSIRSNLHVTVTWQDHVLFQDTSRITLLAPDEWRDDDDDRFWLPSFVAPRDPAVNRILHLANQYLMAFLEDESAGFDGYQSVSGAGETTETDLDLQIRAIWSALVYSLNLRYINPPPTSAQQSQRLRTPGEMLETEQGTCIDLTLLLAACFEYIDVYPVIFLLYGHAFAGYWRNPDDHRRFVTCQDAMDEMESGNLPAAGPAQPAGKPTAPHRAWYFGEEHFDEIIRYIYDERLVPLEATLLTQRGGFHRAIDEGIKNLRNRSDFQAMMDIRIARDNGVTPLPTQRRNHQ
ncbi:MAG: hypothetical protein K1Y36_20060 [Blastocatellia bacterium]|nr:hypothetical protein [Blastocatellia bacterium]